MAIARMAAYRAPRPVVPPNELHLPAHSRPRSRVFGLLGQPAPRAKPAGISDLPDHGPYPIAVSPPRHIVGCGREIRTRFGEHMVRRSDSRSPLVDGAARAERSNVITQRKACTQGFYSGIALAERQRRDNAGRPGEVAIEPQRPAGECAPG